VARINYQAFIKASSRLSLHYSFDTSIGRHFVSFLTYISCFYIYLVKHFNLNEKFILLKNSSDRIGILFQYSDRIGFGLDNSGSDWILNIRQLSDYKRPIRSDAHLYCPLRSQERNISQTDSDSQERDLQDDVSTISTRASESTLGYR
jgi:hypothetical protein